MNGSPLEKRAERRERNHSSVDLNLVALIDIFTILIFFLLSNMAEVQALPSSTMETLVVVVNDADLIVDGRRVAAVADVLRSDDEVIAPLKAELDLLAGRRVVQQDRADEARAITIMGDKDIPYRLLRRVMVTCARAGFSDVAFAVQRRDS